MPNAHNKAKMSGDTHLPDVESELPLQEGMSDGDGVSGTPSDRGQATERGQQNRPGRGIRKAGVLKDRDAQTSNSYGHTRDSGEGGPSRR